VKTPNILVVGSLVMDLIVTATRFPDAGESVVGKEFRTAPGGKGANQAVQAARLGANVTMVGMVGEDAFGQQLIDSLRKSGVNTAHVMTAKTAPTAIANIQIQQTDTETQNRILVVLGANNELRVADVSFLEDTIARYDIVLLQNEIPEEINVYVAALAKAAGVPVMLNPAPATDLDDELLRYVTYLTPNEQEASTESGLPLRSGEKGPCKEDLQKIGAALWAKGVENVIITLGSAGSAIVEGDSIHYISPVYMPHVADPTGAGDSFVAAMSVGLSVGLSREQAMAFASHTAAITVSRMGAMPSLPVLDEVILLLKDREYNGFDLSVLDVLK